MARKRLVLSTGERLWARAMERLGQAGAVGDAELDVNPLEVVVDGAAGQEQLLGDLSAHEATGGE